MGKRRKRDEAATHPYMHVGRHPSQQQAGRMRMRMQWRVAERRGGRCGQASRVFAVVGAAVRSRAAAAAVAVRAAALAATTGVAVRTAPTTATRMHELALQVCGGVAAALFATLRGRGEREGKGRGEGETRPRGRSQRSSSSGACSASASFPRHSLLRIIPPLSLFACLRAGASASACCRGEAAGRRGRGVAVGDRPWTRADRPWRWWRGRPAARMEGRRRGWTRQHSMARVRPARFAIGVAAVDRLAPARLVRSSRCGGRAGAGCCCCPRRPDRAREGGGARGAEEGGERSGVRRWRRRADQVNQNSLVTRRCDMREEKEKRRKTKSQTNVKNNRQ